MAKRFTETAKWERPWFRSLPMEYKLFWLYLCDACNVAGIWYVDIDMASFVVGFKLELSMAKSLFTKQITEMEGGIRWLIRDFIEFQYGTLRPNNNFHRSIISSALAYGLDVVSGVSQGLSSPTPGAQERDKEKEEVRRRKGEGVGEGDFEALWKRYPRRVGRKSALRHFLTSVSSPDQLPVVSAALDNYLAYIKAERVERKYIQHGATWFYNWEDWVDYKAAVPQISHAGPSLPRYCPPPVDESDLPSPEEAADFRAMAEAAIKGAKK